MRFSRRFVSVTSTAALWIAMTSSGCSVVGVPRPIHPDVEPPDRSAEYKARRAKWIYTPSKGAPKYVTLPIEDLVWIGEDLDDWKISSQAHHDAVEWEDDDAE